MVLVEGESDRQAIEALASRRDRDLDAEGVDVLAMGGATNVGRFLARCGPQGLDLRLAGLCDVGEEPLFARGLDRIGLGPIGGRADLERAGFFVCDLDLEDELVRALGAERVVELLEAQGELASFRTFQRQPAQRARPVEHQLRRFLGTRSGRKVRYGRLLVDALPTDRVPAPLEGVLAATGPG